MPRRSTVAAERARAPLARALGRLLLVAVLSSAASCLLSAPSDDDLVGSCGDGKKNGPETDVDCGGGCRPCAESRGCKLAADCTTASCIDGGCAAPSCSDKVKNGDETDVDCGGPNAGGACPYCKLGKSCVTLDDCDYEPISLICIDTKCAVDTCSDGKKSGDETDLDCGGSCVPDLAQTCLEGEGCKVDDDCESTCSNGKCAPPSCTDKKLNGFETDVDCGGTDPRCARCGPGKDCTEDADCASPSTCDMTDFVCT